MPVSTTTTDPPEASASNNNSYGRPVVADAACDRPRQISTTFQSTKNTLGAHAESLLRAQRMRLLRQFDVRTGAKGQTGGPGVVMPTNQPTMWLPKSSHTVIDRWLRLPSWRLALLDS